MFFSQLLHIQLPFRWSQANASQCDTYLLKQTSNDRFPSGAKYQISCPVLNTQCHTASALLSNNRLSLSWMIALIPWNRSGSSTNNSLRVHRITLLPCASPVPPPKCLNKLWKRTPLWRTSNPGREGARVVFKSHIWYSAKTDSSAIMWLMVYRLCVCMRFYMCVCVRVGACLCAVGVHRPEKRAVATRFAPAGWRLSECKQNSV